MKAILRSLPSELELKRDETFTSEANDKIRRKLVPELLKAMKPKFQPTYEQINNWLKALYKHRRSRYMYQKKGVLDRDNQRLHSNNRISEIKMIYFLIYRLMFNTNYGFR